MSTKSFHKLINKPYKNLINVQYAFNNSFKIKKNKIHYKIHKNKLNRLKNKFTKL
jgi:hypothetical protein